MKNAYLGGANQCPFLEADVADGIGDISIRFTVLRPGKKLHEKLLVGSEVSGTDHPRIMCADERMLEFDRLQNLLQSLQRACDDINVSSIGGLIKNVAVEFSPTGAVTDLLCHPSEHVLPSRGANGKTINLKKKCKRK